MSITELALAKRHCHVVGSFHDDMLQLYLDASEQSAAEYLERNLYARDSDLATARAGAMDKLTEALEANDAARTASEALVDCTARDAALAMVAAQRAAALTEYRRTMAGIVVTPLIHSAILLITGSLYENREDVVVANGITVAVEMPLGSRALLQPYRAGIGV